MNQPTRCFVSPPLTVLAALLVAAVIVTTATPAYTQNLYGTLIGNVTDAQGANIPGVTVTIKDENTGLELSGVTDGEGTYTIRNITGGTYTLKAALQGFKEFVQTGIPITAGGIVRINGRLEIGALSEAVTVTTEARPPEDGQGRRQRRPAPGGCDEPAAEPVPELSVPDEPGPGRHAARVPERADGHARALAVGQRQWNQSQQQRHAHRRRREHQRVAAASRGLCCAGGNDRERQHLDQQFRLCPGHDGWRGHCGPDEVGDEHVQGLGLLLPSAG